ncbi:MAG: hypothetical protein ABI741_12425 [Ferruginibacter sp.]
MNFLTDRAFIKFVIKFLLVFAICYFGTILVIGLTVPGGLYSAFVDNYLDYVSWIRNSLLYGSKAALSVFGFNTYIVGDHNLRIVNGRGIRVEYVCVGYGVMSFWIAFVVASAGSFKKKVLWIIGGLLFIWLLNITRLSLLLVAINKGWPMPLGWDHHTWFNIFAYLFIFTFMFLFNRQDKENEETSTTKK